MTYGVRAEVHCPSVLIRTIRISTVDQIWKRYDRLICQVHIPFILCFFEIALSIVAAETHLEMPGYHEVIADLYI